jgi:beta-lactamase regulating signal transducer with metallopeptidase domain
MAELMQELNSFTGWLLIASLKSLPLIATLLLVQYGLKKYLSASARHSLWLSLCLCLSIPFGWHFSFEARLAELLFLPAENNVASTSIPKLITIPPATALITHTNTKNDFHMAEVTSGEINYHSILSLIWLAVFNGLICTTFWQLLRFKRVLHTATTASAQQYLLLDKNKKILGVTRTIPLVYSALASSPLTLGLFKPTIILPIGIEQQLTEKQLSLVLLHELAHIQRRDILWSWLAYGITLLHWFNPLIWLASKRMKADMEMACDAKVLVHLSPQDRNDYGLTLINVSQLSSKPLGFSHSLGILENHRELKDRLIMIKEFTTMTLKKSLAFGLIFSAFAFAALAQPETKSKEESGHISIEASITLKQLAEKAEQDFKTKILIGINSDSRIQANIGKEPISYEQFLTQLQINGFTAFKTNDYIQILSVRDARTMAPIAEKGKKYYADEFLTDYIKLEKACAQSVLAAVRPLVPQYSHLTTYTDAKTLIIVDSYSNIQRVKNVIATIEQNLDAPKDCAEITIVRQGNFPQKK